MSGLLAAVRAKDEELAHHWSKTEEWGTVEHLIAANCEYESDAFSRDGQLLTVILCDHMYCRILL